MPRRDRKLGSTIAIAATLFVLALVAPASADAAATQFGSPLAPGASGAFGCETIPVIEPTYFNYVEAASTYPDCTWRQSGVFGSLSDPRFSSVPGDGAIVGMSVLSGANPAPLRASVLRQLGTGGFAGQCCFFVSESAPVQPAPNTVTDFPLFIPVQRNTLDGVQAIDLLGVSAQNGAGTLPVRQVGSTNSFALTQNGSVNAGIFYPRIGSIANDSGGGRREEGVPGLELLVRWTFCPDGDTSCMPAQAVTSALLSNQLRVSRNRALIRLICNGSAACEGQLSLLNIGALTAGNAHAAAKTTSYGTVKYTIAPGKRATLKLKLNSKGKKLLKRKRKVKLGLRNQSKSGGRVNATVTLKR